MGLTTKPYYWRSRKAWYINLVSASGKRTKKKLGDTKKAAFDEYSRMLTAGMARRDASVTDDVVFEDLSTQWLERQEQRFEQGLLSQLYLRRVTATIDRWNEDHPCWLVSQMTVAAAQSWLTKPSANYERTELGTIRQCLKWGVKAKLIRSNPLDGLELPGIQRREGIVTPEMQGRILAAANKQLRVLLEMAWLSGCRPGELRKLKWSHFNDDLSEASLPEHKTKRKTGRDRAIYFGDDAQAVLRKIPKESDYVFLNTKGKPWTSNALVQAMDALREKTGASMVAGTYRHTFATNALEKGVDIATVAQLLGHTSTAMVAKIYGHLHEKKQHLKDAAKRAAAAVPVKSDPPQKDASSPEGQS